MELTTLTTHEQIIAGCVLTMQKINGQPELLENEQWLEIFCQAKDIYAEHKKEINEILETDGDWFDRMEAKHGPAFAP